jgi:hypothetical protein
MFDGAYKIYSIFWAMRFNIIKADEVKACAIEEKTTDKPWTTEDIVGKLVDCCNE